MPIPKNKIAKKINIMLYFTRKFANTVKIVAPPNQITNEVIQQQLVPITKVIILAKNDFL